MSLSVDVVASLHAVLPQESRWPRANANALKKCWPAQLVIEPFEGTNRTNIQNLSPTYRKSNTIYLAIMIALIEVERNKYTAKCCHKVWKQFPHQQACIPQM